MFWPKNLDGFGIFFTVLAVSIILIRFIPLVVLYWIKKYNLSFRLVITAMALTFMVGLWLFFVWCMNIIRDIPPSTALVMAPFVIVGYVVLIMLRRKFPRTNKGIM